MATRMKYIKLDDTQYTSEGFINTFAKGEVRVFFNESDMTFRIESKKGSEVIATGKATSPHKVKLKIKRELIKLGAMFEAETRAARKV